MPSFDIVSKVPWNEVDNALQQAQKELAQRYDFKDTDTEITKEEETLTVRSSSGERAKAAWGVLQEKLIKRKVSLKFFEPGDIETTSKGGGRIVVKVKEGITAEPARKLTLAIKEAKLKVQASIQEAQVRVTGKNKDDLQKAIQLVRGTDLGIELSFINFRE
jgi:uncharacterized protein YajQ (UPF0234 family)